MRQIAKCMVSGILNVALVATFCVPAVGLQAQIAEAAETISGAGSYVDSSGTYALAADAAGLIYVAAGINVTLEGSGIDSDPVKDISIVVGDGASLTLKNLYATQSASANPTVDFLGEGNLLVEGTNMLNCPDGYGETSVIHVGPAADVVFGGSGVMYGYKHSAATFIGSNAEEANGTITFSGGTWFLKGSKTGPIIGNDVVTTSSSTICGDITVNEGTALYLKNMAGGAGIGSSRMGVSVPRVTLNGGLVEIYCDYNGSAIGSGAKSENASYDGLTIAGGSLKTIISQNAYTNDESQWDIDAETNAGAVLSENCITVSHNTLCCPIDLSGVAADSEGLYTVELDGQSTIYHGCSYQWTANEVKNPTGPSGTTKDNWVANNAENRLGESVVRDSDGYPSINGSCLAGDTNLYLHLSKENHTLDVNGCSYAVTYDKAQNAFAVTKEAVTEPDPAPTDPVPTDPVPTDPVPTDPEVDPTPSPEPDSPVSLSSANVTKIADSYVYTSKELKPTPVVTVGGVRLTAGTDYTIAYSNNTAVGKATVTITGEGKYEGTVQKTFKIVPKTVKVKKVTSGKKQITVLLSSKVKATGGIKYQLQYRVKGASKWRTVTTTTVSKVVKKLKKGKSYQVRARAVKGSYAGAWSTAKLSSKVK